MLNHGFAYELLLESVHQENLIVNELLEKLRIIHNQGFIPSITSGDPGVGDTLENGERHDGRAPDYDDWTLNCDILFWHKPLGCALELSSMGIRVDQDALLRQLDRICRTVRLLGVYTK